MAAGETDLLRIATLGQDLRRAGVERQIIVRPAGAGRARPAGPGAANGAAEVVELPVGPASAPVRCGRALIVLEPILRRESPDWVLTLGDDPVVLGAALAAATLGRRSARLEAGLRLGEPAGGTDRVRALADRAADLLFTSEQAADENLAREGLTPGIRRVGSLTVDLMERHLATARRLGLPGGLTPRGYLLVVLAENGARDGAALILLMQALAELAASVPVALACGPVAATALRTPEVERLVASLHAAEAVTYPERLALLSAAAAVLTDDGTVQEEATALGIPCLIPGRSTDRPVTVTRGTGRLVAHQGEELWELARVAVASPRTPRRPELWDGRAGERIATELLGSGL